MTAKNGKKRAHNGAQAATLAVVSRSRGWFRPYDRNPVKNDGAVGRMAGLIREFGFRIPMLARSNGEVIDGHLRLKAAEALGLESLPVILCDDWSVAQVKAFRLASRNSAAWAEWDDDLVALELGDLKEFGFDLALTGFDDGELRKRLAPSSPEAAETAPPVPENPVSKAGEIYELGPHRLLCGDSTSREDVSRLLGGQIVDLTYTDPPYGVGYTGGAKKRRALAGDNVGTDIYGAALPHLSEFAADHAALYLWYADAHAAAAAAAAAAAGYAITAQIIWVKNHAQFVTSAHYKGKHEPCFYAHRRGKTAAWYGPNNEVTTWEENRSPRNGFHPTQKPVALASRAIANSSKVGDAVLDLFGGSGSTMIACEQAGRRNFTMEIDPGYCDVIRRRYAEFVGRPELAPS